MSMDHNEMIAVIQAHGDGKAIECRELNKNAWPKWRPVNPPEVFAGFDFQGLEYRIKPEPPKPREWWLHWCAGSDRPVVYGHNIGLQCEGATVHVREVLP